MHPVIKLIHDRNREGSIPGHRTDECKLGLAIEGGGMRGVVAGGMVAALEYFGLRNVFDGVYGASAGSITGAYFLAGQAALGTTIYYENINNSKFINEKPHVVLRFLAGKQVMYLDYLFEVMRNIKVLDWEKVISSDIPLKIGVSSLDERKAVMFDSFSSREDLFIKLKAGATIPVVGGDPVLIENRHYWDVSLYQSIPIEAALEDKCTHILVLKTRPKGEVRKPPGKLSLKLLTSKLAKQGEGLDEDYVRTQSEYQQLMASLSEMELREDASPYLHSVELGREVSETGRLEKDRNVLAGAAGDGMVAMLNSLTGGTYQANEVIMPYDEISHQLSKNLFDLVV